MSEPRWLADPLRAHEYRYWDGRAWTAHVADSGLSSWDERGLPRLALAAQTAGGTRKSPLRFLGPAALMFASFGGCLWVSVGSPTESLADIPLMIVTYALLLPLFVAGLVMIVTELFRR